MSEFLEEIDETRTTVSINTYRRRRAVVLALLLVLVGLIVWYLWPSADGGPADSGFVFDEPDAPLDETLQVPDLVDPRLVTRLQLAVVVRAGDGERFSRIVEDPPLRVLPAEPGVVVVALVRSGPEGRVVVTGPPGWSDDVCVVASITTANLRPLDTIQWSDSGACIGLANHRDATPRCVGENTVVLAIDVPQEPVELVEGGQGVAESLRVQLMHDLPRFETASVRGEVDVSDQAIEVPELAGPGGAEVEFELGGAGARVACTFT